MIEGRPRESLVLFDNAIEVNHFDSCRTKLNKILYRLLEELIQTTHS